ncbi:class I SAM-dependent methyltransferase [Maribacter sp. 2307ULW6-5]|uniref:class I SAM-dependent methyltransferase n=1 Tax=Maribacter sp. 2307ULW6-5 TaxID=3386275 RepID=UPI0039BD4811
MIPPMARKHLPIALLGLLMLQCKGQTTKQGTVGDPSLETPQRYTYRKGDPNGTGKWYMGREIAHVMGFQGMAWLERPERDREEDTAALLKNLDIQEGDTIADIGAGSGYHIFKMAPKVGAGHLYAVDIQQEMLNEIQRKKEVGGLTNISTVKGSATSAHLEPNTVDKVLMVDVYHEFDHPYEMMTSIYGALRPNGKLYLVEYRAEDAQVPIKRVHKMSEAQAVKEMAAVGFTLEKNIENLPWQHCLVFVKKSTANQP